MTDPIKKALTKKVSIKHGRGKQTIEIPPNQKLVLGVKFAIAMTALLSTLEITHMALLKTWSTEIFSTITGLTGTITGILITTKT